MRSIVLLAFAREVGEWFGVSGCAGLGRDSVGMQGFMG